MTSLIPLLFCTEAALAQETIDIGVLKDKDISVVQRMLYTKANRMEIGGAAVLMPFDAYTVTPAISGTITSHQSESTAYELAVGGGYSFANGTYKQLSGPAYQMAPDAYRYLGSVVGSAQWSPIYAKMNWNGNRVLHHDVYGLAGGGLSIEQAMLPDHSIALAPTLALGIGSRVFLSSASAFRIQIRDDILAEQRVKTADTQGLFVKHNIMLSVGYSVLGATK